MIYFFERNLACLDDFKEDEEAINNNRNYLLELKEKSLIGLKYDFESQCRLQFGMNATLCRMEDIVN
jgi:hypothetical protein